MTILFTFLTNQTPPVYSDNHVYVLVNSNTKYVLTKCTKIDLSVTKTLEMDSVCASFWGESDLRVNTRLQFSIIYIE